MQTRLTDALQIEHPVMLAGMGGVSYHTLVAAVSEAGGFGCLGASAMTQDEMVEEIRAVKAATTKPFGVDLLTALPEQMMSNIELVIREGAQVFVAGLGVPRNVIKLCHDNNVLVVNMCGKVRHAVAAVEAGCDIVVAQGTEAGGHTGTVATMPLVPQIVDAVGVWIGTRFIATPEARSTPGYKEALVRAAEDDTVISRAFTGKTLRAVRNKTTQYYDEHPEELRPFPEQIFKAVEEGTLHLTGGDEAAGVDPDRECYPAGQGTGAIENLVPAGELVRRFVTEAEAVIESLGGLRAQAPA
jgi:enoyl-[acyl-carrier protein] reductase II